VSLLKFKKEMSRPNDEDPEIENEAEVEEDDEEQVEGLTSFAAQLLAMSPEEREAQKRIRRGLKPFFRITVTNVLYSQIFGHNPPQLEGKN
jgi:hypothetical protein